MGGKNGSNQANGGAHIRNYNVIRHENSHVKSNECDGKNYIFEKLVNITKVKLHVNNFNLFFNRFAIVVRHTRKAY